MGESGKGKRNTILKTHDAYAHEYSFEVAWGTEVFGALPVFMVFISLFHAVEFCRSLQIHNVPRLIVFLQRFISCNFLAAVRIKNMV